MSSTMHGPGGPSVLKESIATTAHVVSFQDNWNAWSMGAQALMNILIDLEVINDDQTYWLGVDSLTNWQDRNEQRNTI